MRPLTLVLAGLLAATVLPARADPPELVGEVQAASVSRVAPGTLVVCARGVVPTGGYTHPKLVQAGSASRDGVYDLDFTAVRPTGMATQMVSQVSARFTWRNSPADLKGVRVRGEHGSTAAELGDAGGC